MTTGTLKVEGYFEGDPPEVQRERVHRLERDHRGGAEMARAEQGLLAEEVARPEDGQGDDVPRAGRHAYGDMARAEQMEGRARLSLVEDGVVA